MILRLPVGISSANPGAVPKYLEQQKEGHWNAGDLMTIEDAASKKM